MYFDDDLNGKMAFVFKTSSSMTWSHSFYFLDGKDYKKTILHNGHIMDFLIGYQTNVY